MALVSKSVINYTRVDWINPIKGYFLATLKSHTIFDKLRYPIILGSLIKFSRTAEEMEHAELFSEALEVNWVYFRIPTRSQAYPVYPYPSLQNYEPTACSLPWSLYSGVHTRSTYLVIDATNIVKISLYEIVFSEICICMNSGL